MNSRERVLTALKLQKPDRVPFMELGIDYDIGARILGKNDYTQFELAEFLKLDGIGTTCYPICPVSKGGRRQELYSRGHAQG